MERARPASNISGTLDQLEQLSRHGSSYAAQGIDYDELGDFRNAHSFYAQSLQYFARCLTMTVAQGSSADLAKANVIQEKVRANALLVQDRLKVLPAPPVAPPPSQAVPLPVMEQQPTILDRITKLLIPKPASCSSASTQDWVSLASDSSPKPVVKASAAPPPRPPATTCKKEENNRSEAARSVPLSKPKQEEGPSAAKQNDQSLLTGVDKGTQKRILDVAVDNSPGVAWADISGLDTAKRALYEAVVLPSLRPDLFTGLTKPASGVLLFGPPGCGKTMLAKAVATESKTAFFSISASSLMSKYMGESESLVKGLFSVARYVAPSVIFIDEIDSLLSERSDSEHEASRRVKTEFLVQWDGITTGADKRVLVMGATNRPFDLDEAALRRMPQRIYIPLPDAVTRKATLVKLLTGTKASMCGDDLDFVVGRTEGYSQSDLTNLAGQAAMEPLRELSSASILTVKREHIRGVCKSDFEAALAFARPSVDSTTLSKLETFASKFGMQ